jgi:predicted RNase H-like HicB family nuclease
MAAKTIRIVIKEMEQDGETYYLGRSPDLYGFTIQASTIEEAINLVPEVAEDLMEVNRELSSKNPSLQLDFWDKVKYQIIYKPMKVYDLQYA